MNYGLVNTEWTTTVLFVETIMMKKSLAVSHANQKDAREYNIVHALWTSEMVAEIGDVTHATLDRLKD